MTADKNCVCRLYQKRNVDKLAICLYMRESNIRKLRCDVTDSLVKVAIVVFR